MRIIHDVARTVGDNTASEVVLYEFAQEPVDMWQNIHDAIIDYCATPEGRQRVADGQMLTYGDFLDFVPNEFCKKHGFERIFASAEAAHYDSQRRIMYHRSMAHYFRQLDQAQERQDRLKKVLPVVAAELNRVRESNPKLSAWSFAKMTTTAVRLTEEYVDNDLSGLRDFVELRLEQLTSRKSTRKSEAPA